MPGLRAEAGSRPACESLSFASPKERNQRKGDPAVCDPCASLRGNLRCSVTGCTAELAARLRRSARTTAVSQFTKHAREGAHATPRPARPRRIQKGTRESDIHTGHRCARPSVRSAWRLRPRDGAERSNGPCGCPIRGFPSVCAWGAQGAGWRVCRRTHPLRQLTRRGCLNGAPQARSEFHGAPRARAPQVAPQRSEGVADSRVAFLLGTFLWRSKEKYLARRGETRPPPSTRERTTTSTRLRKARTVGKQPNYKNNSYQRLLHKRHSPKTPKPTLTPAQSPPDKPASPQAQTPSAYAPPPAPTGYPRPPTSPCPPEKRCCRSSNTSR